MKQSAPVNELALGRRFKSLLCTVGLHDWGRWQQVKVLHQGEFPWDTWQHYCHASQRVCDHCGHRSRLRKKCRPPFENLPPQRG